MTILRHLNRKRQKKLTQKEPRSPPGKTKMMSKNQLTRLTLTTPPSSLSPGRTLKSSSWSSTKNSTKLETSSLFSKKSRRKRRLKTSSKLSMTRSERCKKKNIDLNQI
jgi:hypothetical protein